MEMNMMQTTAQKDMLTITDKTTLGELLTMLGLEPRQQREGKTPTRVKLIASAGEPVAKMSGVTLYTNGYALYENGHGRYSVIWLPYCTDFTYSFNKLRDAEKDYLSEKSELPDDLLLSAAWTAAVALFGEERITLSMTRGYGNADTDGESDEEDDAENEEEDVDDEGRNFIWDDDPLGVDPLDAVIRKETREAMLAEMTDKQREVFVLYHKYGWTQQRIADTIGIAQQNVHKRLTYANRVAQQFIHR